MNRHLPLSKAALRSSRFILLGLIVFGLTLASVPRLVVHAAAGDLDPTFGGNGEIATDFSYGTDLARGVAIQSNGQIIAAGSSNLDFALARYNTNGSLDSTFGLGGRVTTDFFGSYDQGNALALQPDGKIIVAGSAVTSFTFQDFALARYNPDGSLDMSFGAGGKVTTDFFEDNDGVNAVALQSDGKIIAAGRSFTDQGAAFALARYYRDGTLDSTFGSGGKLVTSSAGMSISSLVIQPDGKIIAAGTPGFSLVRYNPNGTLDSSFGSGGNVKTNINGALSAIALQSNMRIVAVGTIEINEFDYDFALLRYNSNGSLDSNFGFGGMFTISFENYDTARALAIQSDGKIVVSGQTAQGFLDSDFAIARLNSNGSLDSTFGQGGKVITDFSGDFDIAWAVVVQHDGKILAAGDSFFSVVTGWDFALARYDGGTSAFDLCVQDDSSGNILQINTTTGDYQFTNCAGLTLGGTGTLTRRGGLITLQHNATDRRLNASIDTPTNKATATVQLLSQGRTLTIIDRNITNNTCACR